MKRYLLIFVSNLLLLILLLSCTTTKTIEVPVEVVKKEYVDKVQHDSIYINTSTEISTRNDTVFQTKIQYKYKYKYLKDTICIRDTIPKIVKIKEVEYTNILTNTQKTFYWIGILVTIFGIVYIVFKFKKF